MKTRLFIFILLILSIVPLVDFFHPGLPITHDGQDHVARIANFYQNLTEGNLIPRWAGNLNWGYGHPILMFLYPLPSYLVSFFHFIGFGLIDSTKLVFGITFILSGLTMYLWINEFLGKRAAFISSLLYLFAPYRFVDLYVRGALGEHVAFVFPPLVLYFLIKLSRRYSYWYIVGGSLSLVGLILSHNAISLMFLPLFFLYALYLLWQTNNKKLVASCYLLVAILGFSLSAFFWVPAFFEGKYTLRDIVTAGELVSRFANFKDLIYGQWSYGISGQFSVQVGIVQWLVVVLSLPAAIFLYLHKRKDKSWILTITFFLIFLMSLFLMTDKSRFIWEKLSILQKFQFPWRFLSVTVFTSAVLGGLVVYILPKKIQLVAYYVLLIALVWFNKDYWQAKDFLQKEESFFTGIYKSTTDTGESSPRWSVRFMEKEPQAHLEVITGEAKIEELGRISTEHNYNVEVKEKTRLRENTLYFPGWEILVDGEKVDIEFQDPANRGLMTFFIKRGEHLIKVQFKETKLRLLTDILSGVSLAVIFFYSILKATKLWQR